jgi:glycerophosphoryl diester phosphodiesterase
MKTAVGARAAVALLAAVGSLAAAESRRVVVIAHRGEHLAHRENTLAAYRAAWEAGADYIETDVRTTADGKLVILHDRTVDRTTKGKGEVARMRLDEVRRLDPEIPTFDAVLAFARGKVGVYIDAKQASARDLVDAVVRRRIEDRVVLYGAPELLAEAARLSPRLRIMPEAVSAEALRRRLDELRPKVVAFDARDFHDETIALARQAGAAIYVDRLGPADNPAAWEDAVRRGAAGIQTDHPARLVDFLRTHGWRD